MIKFTRGGESVEYDADFSQQFYNYIAKTKQLRDYKIESEEFELKDGLFIKKSGTNSRRTKRTNKEADK